MMTVYIFVNFQELYSEGKRYVEGLETNKIIGVALKPGDVVENFEFKKTDGSKDFVHSFFKNSSGCLIFWSPACPECPRSLSDISYIASQKENFKVLSITAELMENQKLDDVLNMVPDNVRSIVSEVFSNPKMEMAFIPLDSYVPMKLGVNKVPFLIIFDEKGVITKII